MVKRREPLPSLFDDEPEEKAPPEDELPRSSWQEVPQAVFDGWSDERQLAYCAARDMDAALYAMDLSDAQWFKQRALLYRKDKLDCR